VTTDCGTLAAIVVVASSRIAREGCVAFALLLAGLLARAFFIRRTIFQSNSLVYGSTNSVAAGKSGDIGDLFFFPAKRSRRVRTRSMSQPSRRRCSVSSRPREDLALGSGEPVDRESCLLGGGCSRLRIASLRCRSE
jgi:hypothetical protein